MKYKYYPKGHKVFLYNSLSDNEGFELNCSNADSSMSQSEQKFYIVLSGEVKVLVVDKDRKDQCEKIKHYIYTTHFEEK